MVNAKLSYGFSEIEILEGGLRRGNFFFFFSNLNSNYSLVNFGTNFFIDILQFIPDIKKKRNTFFFKIKNIFFKVPNSIFQTASAPHGFYTQVYAHGKVVA